MRTPSVAVIIVTWNGIDDTLECLESLKSISYKNYEIIVIDNASRDDTKSKISRIYPEINILENERNLGFASAVNIGLSVAKTQNFKYALLLNNDTVVNENFLSELVNSIEKKPEYGIVGSKIYYYNTDKVLWFAGGEFTPSQGLFHNVGQQEKDNEQIHEKEVDFVSGCSMLIKLEILNSTGLLNEKYESYVEDVEFNLKTIDAGYKVIFVPSSVVWHKVSRSSGGEVNTKKTYLKVRNSIFFGRGYMYKRLGLISFFYVFKYILLQLLRSIEQRSVNNFITVLSAVPAGMFTSL